MFLVYVLLIDSVPYLLFLLGLHLTGFSEPLIVMMMAIGLIGVLAVSVAWLRAGMLEEESVCCRCSQKMIGMLPKYSFCKYLERMYTQMIYTVVCSQQTGLNEKGGLTRRLRS